MAVTLKGNNGTYEGTSEDSKPLDVPVNTEFNELDTGKTYYFDGETWNEEPPCEGSGFTPTTEQLAAMNSGITTEDVAQIATNENNILLVNTAVSGLQDMLIAKSKVMFNDAGLTQGYYINGDTGDMVSNNDYYASDYIDVANMDFIVLYNTQQSAYYNASKEYMGNFGNINTTLMEETAIDIPEGAKYIRCSVYKTRINGRFKEFTKFT